FLKEQLTVRRRGSDNDIAPLFSLCAEIAIENIVDRVHCLGAATERQNGRIRLCWIVAVGQDRLVMNRRTTDFFCLFEYFRLERLDQEHHKDRHRGNRQHPLRVLLLHLESPSQSSFYGLYMRVNAPFDECNKPPGAA